MDTADRETAASTPLVTPDDDIETPASSRFSLHDKENGDAGRGLGIALMALLIAVPVAALVSSALGALGLAIVFGLVNVAAIIIASIIKYELFCAVSYDLKPNVRGFASTTLILTSIMLVIFVIMIIAYIFATKDVSTEDPAGNDSGVDFGGVVVVAGAAFLYVATFFLYQGVNIVAIIYATLFTFGRGCCAPRGAPVALMAIATHEPPAAARV